MIIVTKGYFCPTCNKELKDDELCAIVGHFEKSCKYCHTDIIRFINKGKIIKKLM